MTESFEQWLEREVRYAATAMLKSVSPLSIIKTRPGFGQIVRPVKGSIVASPVLGAYDPDPDYFFHWYRDAAVVIDALRLLFEAGSVGPEALAHFADFVRFNCALQKLDGRSAPSDRKNAAPDCARFLRDDDELTAVHGDRIFAEARVNPDGTLDISKWARPQADGPPLTALALLRWMHSAVFDAGLAAEVSSLIRAQLDFTFRRWREPSFDIWEEEQAQHYYTLRVSAAALDAGADWLHAEGERETAQAYRTEAAAIARKLDGFWQAGEGCFRSRVLESGERSAKEPDIAVILAAIHAWTPAPSKGGAHSVDDPRMQATLARLDALFDAAYPINRNRSAKQGPALGRYAGDVYYAGGAWYVATLGAAEFCFRAALAASDARFWIERGDAYLATVRAFTPASGELSEQFDAGSGAQTSAKHLAWSYAAFISCLSARRRVLGTSAEGGQ